LNGCLQIFNLCTALTGAFVVEKAGRRLLFLTSTGGMCLTYMVWTILSAKYQESATEFNEQGDPINGNRSIGNAVLFAIFVFYGFYNIALSPVSCAGRRRRRLLTDPADCFLHGRNVSRPLKAHSKSPKSTA
jgi:hypothetical protein